MNKFSISEARFIANGAREYGWHDADEIGIAADIIEQARNLADFLANGLHYSGREPSGSELEIERRAKKWLASVED